MVMARQLKRRRIRLVLNEVVSSKPSKQADVGSISSGGFSHALDVARGVGILLSVAGLPGVGPVHTRTIYRCHHGDHETLTVVNNGLCANTQVQDARQKGDTVNVQRPNWGSDLANSPLADKLTSW